MEEPTHHAISGVPHSTFDPLQHSNLYLDLNNLPLNAEMQAVHPFAGIPAFIHALMNALLRAAFDSDAQISFATQIMDLKIRKPTPPNTNCEICKVVNWILTSCPNPQVCLERLSGLNLITLFEINREIWCRFSPKPILIEPNFLTYVEMIDYPKALVGANYIYPLHPNETFQVPLPKKREVLHEWRNGLSYLAHTTLKRRGELFGRIASFILSIMNIITCLQFSRYHHIHGAHAALYHFYLETVRLQPQSYELLRTLSQAVGSAICELRLMGDYWPGMYGQYPEGFLVEDSDWYQSRIGSCIRTIFALNNAGVYTYGANIDNTFVHNQNCGIIPDQCYCRFANVLQTANP